MATQVMTRNDRVAGIVLLAVSILLVFLPLFVQHPAIAGRPISSFSLSLAWGGAGILLLTADAGARPSRKLTRSAAAFLFVLGLAEPFIRNLVGA